MGSDDDMFRIWSGPEGSSHKEPLSGIRIHRAHGRYFGAATWPGRRRGVWCLGIDGYVVQEAAVLLLEFLQLKRPVSLGWGNGPLFVSGLVDW